MTMLTKLKYVGVKEEDLLNIYVLYIRSHLEYCSTVWHSTLTVEQSKKIESVHKLSLWIILGSEYVGYAEALRWSGLDSLNERREHKCLVFGLKSLVHPVHHKMFPVNPETSLLATRKREHFTVNWAKSESYRQSTKKTKWIHAEPTKE